MLWQNNALSAIAYKLLQKFITQKNCLLIFLSPLPQMQAPKLNRFRYELFSNSFVKQLFNSFLQVEATTTLIAPCLHCIVEAKVIHVVFRLCQ